ncbi:hypothetical protein ALQ33_05245 [Pseudomonas syringae pv. philadelphi]|uniref:YD repeat-containing protein n=1 Tax=Pseudomonas syringae pv. philadelphi TaxID=251706 RepID=A0A3M3Y785_9PSED|nr:hypothetical protein ALQ33_05245 [Pseudomonas syringae pv. philadelphi]
MALIRKPASIALAGGDKPQYELQASSFKLQASSFKLVVLSVGGGWTRGHDRYSDFTYRADAAMDDTPEARRVLCRYRYDALDRVAVINIEAQEAVSRFYQKSRLTVEIQGAVRRRIVHGDDRLLAEHEADGAVARVNLLGTDMQGSVLEAVSGQERQSLAYNPYGHRAQGGPFSGFNGERADPVTGHYLLGNGYRAFNPVLMRFNSPDSLSPFGRGGLNAYAYCQGDPVNRSDPGGIFHRSGCRS